MKLLRKLDNTLYRLRPTSVGTPFALPSTPFSILRFICITSNELEAFLPLGPRSAGDVWRSASHRLWILVGLAHEAEQIVEDHIETGDEDEDQSRGEDDAEPEGDGHRDEVSRLIGSFEHDGSQATKRGQRGQEDGAKASNARLMNDLEGGVVGAASIGVVDHDEGVVDDDAGEGDDPHHAHQREVMPEQDVSDHCADQAKGDHAKHDEGLGVATKGDGEQGVDERQRQREAAVERLGRLAHLGVGALEAPGQAREIGTQRGQFVAFERLDHLAAGALWRDVGADGDDAASIAA